MYDVGEKVVIKESMKQGVVSGVNEENQKSASEDIDSQF